MIGALLQLVTGGLVDRVLKVWTDYRAGKVSEAEFEAKVKIAASETAAKIEQGWAEAASAMTAEVQASVRSSPVLQRAWASVLFLQVAVLVFYQIGAPAYQVMTGEEWPDPGTRVEWAYLLIGAMIGAGPLVFRR